MELNLPLDFKEFLKLLNENKARYFLLGGLKNATVFTTSKFILHHS